MRERVIGYAVLVAIYLAAVIFGSQFGMWLPATAAIVAAVVGTMLGKIGPAGITIAFALMSFLGPVVMLYLIGTHAGMDQPMQKIFEHLEWLRVLLPWLCALGAYFLIAQIQRGRAG